jgi:putative ABC transport system substrate-binding protein
MVRDPEPGRRRPDRRRWARRELVRWLAGTGMLAAAGCLPLARPSERPVRGGRVGYLSGNPLDYPAPLGAPHVDSFRAGLRELGYVEGQNLRVEYRAANLRFDELPHLASELVGLPVDVLVVADTRSIQPAKQATSTTPTVLVVTTDPVASGHVASLARPGGHITGLTMAPVETMGKRLELLREVVPRISCVGVLYSADDQLARLAGTEVVRAAATLGLTAEQLAVQQRQEIAPAFDRARQAGVDGLLVYGGPLMNSEARQVAELAVARQLPTMGLSREVVEAGLLMAYAPSIPALYHRAATYVDKILKGTSPAELPVERPTRFDLVLNARTANALGIEFPPATLMTATEVIR